MRVRPCLGAGGTVHCGHGWNGPRSLARSSAVSRVQFGRDVAESPEGPGAAGASPVARWRPRWPGAASLGVQGWRTRGCGATVSPGGGGSWGELGALSGCCVGGPARAAAFSSTLRHKKTGRTLTFIFLLFSRFQVFPMGALERVLASAACLGTGAEAEAWGLRPGSAMRHLGAVLGKRAADCGAEPGCRYRSGRPGGG